MMLNHCNARNEMAVVVATPIEQGLGLAAAETNWAIDGFFDGCFFKSSFFCVAGFLFQRKPVKQNVKSFTALK